jgi:hypothetical protein
MLETLLVFGKFANNSLNLWGDSGIYAITTNNDTSMVTPTPMPSSALAASPTVTPNLTSPPTSNPTATPTLQPEANQLSTQTVAIVAITVFVLVAVFALALKKGYIKVEVVDEEGGEIVEGENEGGGEGGEGAKVVLVPVVMSAGFCLCID